VHICRLLLDPPLGNHRASDCKGLAQSLAQKQGHSEVAQLLAEVRAQVRLKRVKRNLSS
jgi:hypothetical protein